MIPWQAVFDYKPRKRDEAFFKLYHLYCLSICLILTVFRFVDAKPHYRFHKLALFDMIYYWISVTKYLSDILQNVSFPWSTHTLSWILPKSESVAFRQLTRAKNAIWNWSLYEMSNSFCEKAHPASIYTHFNTPVIIPLFSYTDTLFKWSQMKIIKLAFPKFLCEINFY